MRYYSYVEPDEFDDLVVIKTVLSEDEILSKFWDEWSTGMKAQGFLNPTKEQCIEDFCSAYWATEEVVYKVNNQLFIINEHHMGIIGSPYATLVCVDGSGATVDGYVDITKLEIYNGNT